MDKKEKILLAAILAAVSKIEAHLQGAKCEKCGKCGHREAEITKDGLTVLLAAKAMGPMRKDAEPERLPDVPDWRDNANLSDRSDRSDRSDKRRTDGAAQFAADDRLTRIRLTVAAHQGDGLSEIIEAILADCTDLKTLSQILGVNKARISEAKHGHARPGFVARFCEVLGEGGDSANCRTGRTNAGTEVAARDLRSGKRGAK